MRQVNIGSEEIPKYATIGDYWDEEMVRKVTQLLHKYQDLFSKKFTEKKRIIEAVEDILLSVEVRSSVEFRVTNYRLSLLGRSQNYWVCQRRK